MIKKTSALIAAIFMLAATSLYSGHALAAKEATLYKNPQCGCCEEYADYLREAGFKVTVKPTEHLAQMSRSVGLPDDFQGCHLAFIDDYYVSGHVPVKAVNKMLTEKPDIKGITLPGMPQGSPGMGGEKSAPFEIYQIDGGAPTLYSTE